MASTGVAAALKAEGFPETIKAVAESVRMGLRDVKPNEVRVEFGLELTLKSGKVLSVLAEVGGTASVKVELTWIGDDSQASQSESDGPVRARVKDSGCLALVKVFLKAVAVTDSAAGKTPGPARRKEASCPRCQHRPEHSQPAAGCRVKGLRNRLIVHYADNSSSSCMTRWTTSRPCATISLTCSPPEPAALRRPSCHLAWHVTCRPPTSWRIRRILTMLVCGIDSVSVRSNMDQAES